MSSERITWIDKTKCIGMLLVIHNHCSNTYGQEMIRLFIASFHMPLFFILSGITIRCESMTLREYLEYVKRRFKHIMVPYILWAFIFSNGVSVKNIACIIYGSNKTLSIAGSNAMLWFLPCMFISSLMIKLTLPVISMLKNRGGRQLIIIVLVFIYFIFGVQIGKCLPWLEKTDLPFSVNLAFLGNGFILIGYLIGEIFRQQNSFVRAQNKKELFVGIVALIGAVFLAINNRLVFMNDYRRVVMARSLYGNSIMFIGSGITGSLFLITLMRMLPQRHIILDRIGGETLTILAVHIFVMHVLEKMASIEGTNPANILVANVILSMAVLLISYAIAYTIRKTVQYLAKV